VFEKLIVTILIVAASSVAVKSVLPIRGTISRMHYILHFTERSTYAIDWVRVGGCSN